MQQETKTHNLNFLAGLFVGGLLGAVIAVLLGTKEGKKYAEKIIEKAEQYEKELEHTLTTLESKSGVILTGAENIKSKVAEIVEKDIQGPVLEKMIDMNNQDITTHSDYIPKIHRGKTNIASSLQKRFFKKSGKLLT